MSLRIVLIFALGLMVLSIASAESVSIPLKSVKKPASDLILSDGRALDLGEAASRAERGEDLSLLNPVDNRLWQNKNYPAVDLTRAVFPDGNAGVKFLSHEVELPFTYMGRVQSKADPKQFYRFSLSRYSHTTLMRAALLRKLGYYVPSPKYYRNLRVFFDSEKAKETFLSEVQEAMISDFESRGWIKENNKTNHSVVFSDALLEVQTADYFDTQWGYAPNPANPQQLEIVRMFSRNRAFRALILPYVLVDVPESVNRFSAKLGSVLSGHVVLTHPSADSFGAATYEDVRWLVRRLALLDEKDLRTIVLAGEFPEELNELITAKLLYRVNNALELFNVRRARPLNLPSLNINSRNGLVVDGKVTREFVPGYPQRFAHGDRETPFKEGDFTRYLDTRLKSSVVVSAMSEMSKRLQVLTLEKVVTKRQQEIRDRILNHVKTKPWEPLYQDIEAWGGPLGGFNVNAKRQITTGTYYGSNAAIQLVDNISIAGNLGWFMGIDGIPKVTPMGGANVMLLRDYTHVKPVNSIEEGSKVDWKNLVIPSFMSKLADVLTKEGLVDGKTADDPKRQPLDAFLSELRENEVFTVTDSIALSAYFQLANSFDVLLGITPLSVLNSVSLSGDASRIILRQTSFMRTKDGVHVYVRQQKGNVLGLTMDVNYFVNLLKVRAQLQTADLKTDAFIIDYNPEIAQYIDTDQKDKEFVKKFIQTRTNLKPALLALMKSNDPELLYSRFKYQKFEIDHDLKTKELRTRVLIWKSNSFNEDHTVKIRYPRSEEDPTLDPKDEEIILFSNRKGKLVGRDILSFLTDIFGGVANHFIGKKFPGKETPKLTLDSSDDPNPANTPMGKAKWRIVGTEGDLTPNPVGGKPYPNVAVLQHVWGGWKMKKPEFFKLVDEIQSGFKDTGLASYRLIEKEAFANVKSVDFYRVTASLSVLPTGLDRLRDLVLQPRADGRPVQQAPLLLRMVQRLSEVNGKARANDKELFEEIITMLGNGDRDKGHGIYLTMCQAEKNPGGTPESDNGRPTDGWFRGTYFMCMSSWMEKLITLSRGYPKDAKQRVRWTTDVLWVLDEVIPLPYLLKYLGEENFIYLVRVNGFRTGDEDGDLEFFSNTIGDPRKNLDYANGLISMFANKTRISPIELDRTLGGFR